MAKYKNTEFAKGLNCSFAEFKKMFKNIFLEEEMREAYTKATGKNVREIQKGKNTTKRSK